MFLGLISAQTRYPYAEYPNLAQIVRGMEDSKIHESTIRARVIRDLETEDIYD
jgi:hypothetical protein